MLKKLLTLEPLKGYRTYVAAAGLAGLALYELSVGEVEKAAAALFTALGLVGLRGAKGSPPAAAATLMVLFAVALPLSFALAAAPAAKCVDEAPGQVVHTIPESMPVLFDVSDLGEPSASALDWFHDALGLEALHARGVTGKGQRVAILDTGIDRSHPAFAGRIKAVRNFTNDPSADDGNNHGTHCAGLAAGGGPVRGVAPDADIIVGKVLADRGAGLGQWIAAGVDWAVAEKATVISLSLGAAGEDPVITAAVRRALAKGVVVVAAAGNEGPGMNTVSYPGAVPGVICTAAVGRDRSGAVGVADFSSRGPQVLAAAPGVLVNAALPGGRQGRMSGTSMATPVLAGCVALALSQGLTAVDVAKFGGYCDDVLPAGRDPHTGHGVISPEKLLAAIAVKPPARPSPRKITLARDELLGPKGREVLDLWGQVETVEFTLKP